MTPEESAAGVGLKQQSSSRLVYPAGYVRTTYLSTRFVPDDPACEVCRRATCGPYYFHLERRSVRCTRCFQQAEVTS